MTKRPVLAVEAASLPLLRLEAAFKDLEAAGCQELHFTVTDGRMAPGFSMGHGFVAAAQACCGLRRHVHLLVEDVDRALQPFLDAGCHGLTVPVGGSVHIHRTLARIREAGAAAGVSIGPGTSLTRLDYLLPHVDRVTVLATEPGMDAEPTAGAALERIRILRENLDYRKDPVALAAAAVRTPRAAADLLRHGAAQIIAELPETPEEPRLTARFQSFQAAMERELTLA